MRWIVQEIEQRDAVIPGLHISSSYACRYCQQLDVEKVIQEAKLAATTPKELKDVPLRVLLSGSWARTNPAYAKYIRALLVRRARVKELISWYFSRDHPAFKRDADAKTLAKLPLHEIAPTTIVQLSKHGVAAEFGGQASMADMRDDDEEVCRIIATAPITPLQPHASELLGQLAESEEAAQQLPKHVHVSASNTFVPDYDAAFLPKCFIEHFPYRRGGPDEKRRVAVSKEACIEHYLRLSTRAFRGYRFILCAYGIIARARAGNRAVLKAGRSTGAGSYAEAFAKLKPDEIKVCAQYLEECSRASKRHSSPPAAPQSLAQAGLDKDFFRSIKTCASAMPHTHEVRLCALACETRV